MPLLIPTVLVAPVPRSDSSPAQTFNYRCNELGRERLVKVNCISHLIKSCICHHERHSHVKSKSARQDVEIKGGQLEGSASHHCSILI